MANKYAVEMAFKLIDNATAPLTKIGKEGKSVGKALKKDFMKAQDQLADLGKKAKKAGLVIAAAGVAAAGAFAVKGIKDAIELSTEITKISTVADLTNISLEDLRKEIMEVSNSTGIAASELAKYQYTVINSGIDTADSAAYVAAAVRTAKAGFADAGVVISGLTKIMNAYQLEASEAERIAGQMYLTTTIGNASFEELESSLSKVLPTAARLNVGTDELFASISALTANAIETPKAIKGIEKILETVQKPTDAVSKAARRLGIDFSVTALETKGLAGFLEDIREKTGGSDEAIMSLFGSVESLNAINILTSRGAETFASALEEMRNASSAVDAAFNKVMASPAERWAAVMNKIKNAGINLGTALLPVVEKVMVKVDDFVNKLKDFDFQPIADKAAIVFDKIWGFANVIIKLAGFIWKLRVPILMIINLISLYKGGMLLAAAAVNAYSAVHKIATGVKLAGIIVTKLYTKAMTSFKASTIGAKVATVAHTVAQKAAMGINFAGAIIKQGAAFVALKAQLIAAKVATIAYAVAEKAAAIAKGIATAAQWALNAAMTANPIGLIIAGIATLIAIIVLCVKNWDKITNALKVAWEWFKNVASIIWDKIINAFKAAGEWIKNVASIIWDSLCKAFNSLKEYIKENSEKVLAFISIFSGPFAIIISIVKELKENWSKVVEAFQTDGIIAGFKRLGGVILSAVLAPIQGLLEVLAKIPGVDKLLGPAVEKIKNFREELKGNEVEIVSPAIAQTTTQTAGAVANMPYNVNNRNNQTISAAATPATRPMTTAERYTYSQVTNREEIDIAVRSEPGTSAQVPRQTRSPNVRVTASGGN